MTTRLLVIGNSHIAALIAARDKDPARWDGLTIDRVALRGHIVREAEIRKGRFQPISDDARERFAELNGGQENWVVTGYDAIAVVGLDFKPLSAVALSRRVTWRKLPSILAEEDLSQMGTTLVSEAAARAAIEGRLENCDAAILTRALKSEVDCPIFLLPCPRISARGKWSKLPRFFGHGRAIKRGDAAEIEQLWETAARAVSRRLGARYITQPRGTVVSHILTRRDFMSAEDSWINTAEGPLKGPDLSHANSAYGSLMLQRLAHKLSSGQDAEDVDSSAA